MIRKQSTKITKILNWSAATLILLTLTSPLVGEERFNMRVEKLASPQQFRVIDVDGNRFSLLKHDLFDVACIMYGGPQRYFVEVTLTNRSVSPVILDRRLVTVDPGQSIVQADTLAVAEEIKNRADAPSIRSITPPPNVEPIVAAMEATARLGGQAFANHILAFSHERQSLTLEPGETRLSVFVFNQLARTKTRGLTVVVRVGSDLFLFPYK